MRAMKRVIELVRVSSSGQAEDDKGGIPAQHAANERTASMYGLEIVSTLEMVDVSGTAVLEDARFRRLLKDLKRDDIDGVVTREFSRLMRPENLDDFYIIGRFQEANKLLFLPDGPVDFTSRSGRLLGGIRALIAGEEREAIRERMMGGKEALRRQGRWAAGLHQLPFGVAYDQKTYKFSYKPEAEKVREIYRRFLAGDQNYDALSDYLGMARGTARNILEHSIYKGVLVYEKQRDLSSKGVRAVRERYSGDSLDEGKPNRDRRKIERSPEETYRHKVIDPGLISEQDWDRVQVLIAQKAANNLRQRTKTGHFVYNGFVWCAKCKANGKDARLHTLRNQFDRYYYLCSKKTEKSPETGECLCPYTGFMNRDRLEPQLDEVVSKVLIDPNRLQQIYDAHQDELQSKVRMEDRSRLEAHYKSLVEKRRRIKEFGEDGLITKAEFIEDLQKVEKEIRNAYDLLTRANPKPTWSVEQVTDLFAPFISWEFLDREAKRRILSALSPRFYIADYQVQELQVGCGAGEPASVHMDIANESPKADA